MKNKLLFSTALVLTLGAVTLTGCSNSQENKVLSAYNTANKTAKTIKQEMTVKKGSMLIASETVNYDLVAKTKTVKKTTPNDITAENAWKVEEKTTTFDTLDRNGKLGKNDFSTCVVNENSLNATMTKENSYKVLGLTENEVSNDINFVFEFSKEKKNIVINSVEQTYVTNNGNNVTITTTYSY